MKCHERAKSHTIHGVGKGAVLALIAGAIALLAACTKSADEKQGRTSFGSAASAPSLAASTAATEAGFVYTADERGNAISVIDLGTGQVKTIATPISPHNVQVSRDGRLVLVVGAAEKAEKKGAAKPGEMAGMGGMESGRLLIFDTGTMSAEGVAEIAVGREPAHVVVDAQSRRAYVTNSMDNTLSVVDLQQKKVVATIATGKMPHGLRASPDGQELYVADVDDNSVSVIDTARAKQVALIPVGKAPVQVGFTPDGRRAYVSLRDENSVAVVDTVQRKKIASVAVGRNPIQVFATPDGHYIYVANQGTAASPDTTVSVIATADNSVVATIETGKGAHGVVVSGDGKRAFISNIEDDTVAVIDTATRKVTNTIKVGKGPNGITFRGSTQ